MLKGSNRNKIKNYLTIKMPSASCHLPTATAVCVCLLLLLLTSCTELEKPKVETFYSETKPPAKQEFRWSNGKMPKSFDPAKASAPPETDIVRAIYDGLTEIEPKTLEVKPSVAQKWWSSDDHKTWTFNLRQDAKWSNGEKVTASDFVESWKRLSEMGDEVSHHELLKNIVGMRVDEDKEQIYKDSKSDIFSLQEKAEIVKDKKNEGNQNATIENTESNTVNANVEKTPISKPEEKKTETKNKPAKKKVKEFGIKAIGKHTLQVSLIKPDKEFPELVANPIFRPVYAGGKEFESEKLRADIVTNGAFRIFSVGQDGVTLDRSEHYYNKATVKLERVTFVPTNDADGALAAYRNGKVDVVTNAQFEPLALKILTPFTDFKKFTHSALNFYEFNLKQEPFNDRRVREALAIAIERERLTIDEMEGASQPAFNFLPFEDKRKKEKITENVEKAQDLLKTSGYPDGVGFPVIRLVINRNNLQERIANAVKEMWKDNLNIETEIIVKEFNALENVKKDGEYDVIRRGIVLPTTDETANMLAIFSPKKTPKNKTEKLDEVEQEKDLSQVANTNVNVAVDEKPTSEVATNTNTNAQNLSFEEELLINIGEEEEFILTEDQAILDVQAIPLYFPTSYSLVKPYVKGFEMNTLDAPLLKDVQIDNNWQPKKTNGES